MVDYRHYQEKMKPVEARIRVLQAKDHRSNTEELELFTLGGQLGVLDEIVAETREAENAELRDMLARGKVVGGGAYGVGDHGESADFRAFIKTGEIRNAAMSTTDANGGYIVPEPLHAELMELIRKTDPIYALAHKFDLSGNADMMLPYKASHGVVATAAESAARSEQTEPTFDSFTLSCFDYYSDQRATQTVLDSVPGMEELVLRWCYEDTYEKFGEDLAVGDGSTKALGLFSDYAAGFYISKLSTSAGAVLNSNFITLYMALAPKFRVNAVWLMSSATLATCAAFAMPSNANVPLVDWKDGQASIYGRPVMECSSAPAIGASNYPIAFADLDAAYAVGTHRAPSVLRDPYTVPPKVRFYALARLGGRPWHPQACCLLKSNNS
jgi:HK97 family phage major capsid protein